MPFSSPSRGSTQRHFTSSVGGGMLGMLAELGDEERQYVRALVMAFGSFIDAPA